MRYGTRLKSNGKSRRLQVLYMRVSYRRFWSMSIASCTDRNVHYLTVVHAVLFDEIAKIIYDAHYSYKTKNYFDSKFWRETSHRSFLLLIFLLSFSWPCTFHATPSWWYYLILVFKINRLLRCSFICIRNDVCLEAGLFKLHHLFFTICPTHRRFN